MTIEARIPKVNDRAVLDAVTVAIEGRAEEIRKEQPNIKLKPLILQLTEEIRTLLDENLYPDADSEAVGETADHITVVTDKRGGRRLIANLHDEAASAEPARPALPLHSEPAPAPSARELPSLVLPQFRYVRPRAELAIHIQTQVAEAEDQGQTLSQDAVARHPLSDEWEQQFGHRIPGGSSLDQLMYLRRLPEQGNMGKLLLAERPEGGWVLDQIIGQSTNQVITDTVDELKAQLSAQSQSASPDDGQATSSEHPDDILARLLEDPGEKIITANEKLQLFMSLFRLPGATYLGISEELTTHLMGRRETVYREQLEEEAKK